MGLAGDAEQLVEDAGDLVDRDADADPADVGLVDDVRAHDLHDDRPAEDLGGPERLVGVGDDLAAGDRDAVGRQEGHRLDAEPVRLAVGGALEHGAGARPVDVELAGGLVLARGDPAVRREDLEAADGACGVEVVRDAVVVEQSAGTGGALATHEAGDDGRLGLGVALGDRGRELVVVDERGRTRDHDRAGDGRVVEDQLDRRPEPLEVGVADDVDRVLGVRRRRQHLVERRPGVLGERRQPQPGGPDGVGRHHAGAARVRDDGHLVGGERGLAREDLREVEEFLDVVGADGPGLVEAGLVGALTAGHGAGVRRGRLGARGRPAGLDHDDRRLRRDRPGRLDEPAAVVDVFEVAEDDRGVGVGPPVLDEVDLVEDDLVAERDDVLEADVVVGGPVEDGRDERARLAHERDVTGERVLGGERRVQPHGRADDADAVRPDEVEVVLARERREVGLPGRALVAGLAEARRDHDDVAHAGLGDLADDVEGGPDGDGHDGEVDGLGGLADVAEGRPAEDRLAVGVDRDDLAVEVGEQVLHERPADRARPVGRADDRDALGGEQPGEVRHRFPRVGGVVPSEGHTSRAPNNRG